MRLAALLLAALAACGDSVWLLDPHVAVQGVGLVDEACRTGLCPHNENTDLVRRGSAIFLVHRTALSQILGPNSSLRVSRSDDDGKTFRLLAILPAPADRDLRDPHFYEVGGQLAIKALTRLPVTSARDANVDTITVATVSPDDGQTWSPLAPIAPPTWSFWRIKARAGVFYAAAYEDGDQSVVLYRSTDGTTWTAGPVVYGVAADTPLETELVFMPSGRLLALVRVDGTNAELLGTSGRLRTIACWATPPYDRFDCPQELTGQRLDGPLAFLHGDRLFAIARKHLPVGGGKRTALYELGGHLDGGPLTIREVGELPSAGDTAYAGIAEIDADRSLVTWYSSDIGEDRPWAFALLQASDIWQATIDWSKVGR